MMPSRIPGRMEWFVRHRPDLCGNIASLSRQGVESRRLMSLMVRSRLTRVLERMLDENEFLSPYGLRALSKYHQEHPFVMSQDGQEYRVEYEPAESGTGLFGGNSNWRGPVWFPVNFLMIESLQRYHYYYGDDFKVEFPTGSGQRMNLGRSPVRFAPPVADLPARQPTAGVRFSEEPKSSRPTPISAITSGSTNISTETTERESARTIKPGGPHWSRNAAAERRVAVRRVDVRRAEDG